MTDGNRVGGLLVQEKGNSEAIDFRAASEFFSEVSRPLNEARG
jgi:hypothetical protein